MSYSADVSHAFVPSRVPNNKSLLIDVTNLLNIWFGQLRDLESAGQFNERDLETCSLHLLDIAYPQLGFFDANVLKHNFPAVDILSANRELGIQVKLTLDATVVKDARKKWNQHTEPGEILDGSKEFWVIGALTVATRPRWKQTPGVDEWARLTDKLRLRQCSDKQLQAMKDRLLTETRLTQETPPNEKESMDRLLGELKRPAVAALSDSEISVERCVQALEETARLINSGYKTEGLPKPEVYTLPLMKLSLGSQRQLRRILKCMHDVRVQIARHDPCALRPNRIVDAAKLRLQVETNQLALDHGHSEPYPNVPLP